jgi:hypothetical protein
MKLKLPAVALALLEARQGRLDAAQRASRVQLAKTCQLHGYPLHASVAAFEAAYGGLVMADGPKPRKREPSWLFGAHACLQSAGHAAPRGGSKARKLVPVVYSPSDVIYFLDAQGRAFAQDTIAESTAAPFAEDGRALVTRILLHGALFERQESTRELPGLVGEAVAKRLALKLLKEASAKDARFYSDAGGATIVVETSKPASTRVACADQRLLGKLEDASATKLTAPTKLLAPFADKASVRLPFAKLTSLPDVFESLPMLAELDVSGNQLTVLPDSLWRAPALKKLDLSRNPLTTLPDLLGQAQRLESLFLRGCKLALLPRTLADCKRLQHLWLEECAELDVDAALQVIARLPKLKELSLPLSRTLSTLAPLAASKVRTLWLRGNGVALPERLPAGIGQLPQLKDLRIEYADGVAGLPKSQADVRALRLLFHPRFSDADIRKSARAQPEKRYLAAFASTL